MGDLNHASKRVWIWGLMLSLRDKNKEKGSREKKSERGIEIKIEENSKSTLLLN